MAPVVGEATLHNGALMLRTARRVATRCSTHPDFMHSALLIKGGVVLCAAANVGELHAEENVVRQLGGWNGRAPALMSIRVGKSGNLKMAKPCARCQNLLRAKGIKKVLFSGDDGLLHRMKL